VFFSQLFFLQTSTKFSFLQDIISIVLGSVFRATLRDVFMSSNLLRVRMFML
jgi:hypothetical protein